MVIGDGRNNYNPATRGAQRSQAQGQAPALDSAQKIAASWGFGDSEMLTYQKFCHQVVTVQTLNDLAKVADQLIPV